MELNNFIIGSLLGDGGFTKKSETHNTYIVFKHCESQFEYLNWKFAYLEKHGLIRDKTKGIQKVKIKEGSVYPNYQNQYKFSTISSAYLNQYKFMTEKDISKVFNSEILAVWILDDGNISNKVTKISRGTHSLEFCDNIIKNINERIGMEAYLYQHPSNPQKDTINIRASSYEKVKDLILNNFPANLDVVRHKLKLGCNSYPNKLSIKIKYFSDVTPLTYIGENLSDWIDLRASETITLKAGEFALIPLGVGMILPDNYEANIVPRSSTFKNYGIIQTNCFAVIDNSYSGDNDMWRLPVYATRDVTINKNDRICQFRINERQPIIEFEEVAHLNENDRGGFGSTGNK